MMRNSEFIVMVLSFRIEPKRHKRQPMSTGLAHDNETEVLEGGSEVVCCAGKVHHDGAVAVFAEADHLIVLADDLGGAFGEVEGEGGLVGAEVVDVEDEFFGEVFGGAPDDPADAGVDLTLS